MVLGSVERIIAALNQADVRYLVAGGLAVVAHGYVRFTADVDLVLDMDEGNLERAVRALSGLGYRPRAPVPFDEFVEEKNRKTWQEEKGMRVFSLHSPDHPETEVDLFLEPPLDFGKAWAGASRMEVAPGVVAVFLGLDDLIAVKRDAGRPEDLVDVAKLESLRNDE
jgi:hypothetical protein